MHKDPNGLGWFCRGRDITELMHNAVRGHLSETCPDAVLNIETHLFNVTLAADSCKYTLDVGKELWLNRQRWSRLTKEYINGMALDRFIMQCQQILCGDAREGATANMLFRDPKRADKKHRWGGCLMGATFCGYPAQPTITFYSRTTYMGYIGLLDAAIAAVIARTVCYDLDGVTPEDIAFRWHITSQQLHCFKTLPFIYSQRDLMRSLDRMRKSKHRDNAPPTWYHILKWYDKVLQSWSQYGTTMLEHEKYGPFKRIKRRWLEHMRHVDRGAPPSLKIDELDFSKVQHPPD